MLGFYCRNIKEFTKRIYGINNKQFTERIYYSNYKNLLRGTNIKTQQQIINIIYPGKPLNPGKNPTNEISLYIGQNPGQSGQVSLHHSPPGLTLQWSLPSLFIGSITCNTMSCKPWVHKTMFPKTTTIYPSQHWLYPESCLANNSPLKLDLGFLD